MGLRKRKVYIVSKGEDHEGGEILGVFSTRKKANAYAATVPFNFKDWRPDTVYPGLWRNGCDWLEVAERVVK